MAASTPAGNFVEIGTSAGYSALWNSLALRERSAKLHAFEVLLKKIKLAEEIFRLAVIDDQIELISADAREHLTKILQIAFCFLDAEKKRIRRLLRTSGSQPNTGRITSS